MSEFVRAFLAFDIDSDAVKKKLTYMQTQAVQTGADLKLVEPENIHMTIRFLGDITLNMADKIFEEMQKTQFKPFPVQLTGLGVFPSLSYPRVVWAGIALGADQLQNVFEQIEPRLQKLGLTPDNKAFSPHLTIARVRSARNKPQLAEFVTKNAKYDFGAVEARCLRLKRSQLTPKGPIYSTLKEYCPK
ncbi:MAG: RNA 2',3'-cyclic phosphodiesterase [Candidatus Bathyarchaeota archaeon]|nr:RNA 2',3'-cyclic phosphodiesterase [Candidatus Bathyarchaeota archaeon]